MSLSQPLPIESAAIISYVRVEQVGFVHLMQRLALAFIAVAIVIGLTAFLLRGAASAMERLGTHPAIATGGTMQKAAFFLLLCLIMYVSVSGGS